ncbi:MAG: hypothetical protein K0R61_4461 [Microvirga sp.]|nr:hypothetical protein [Microvirga sp.]
MPRPVMMLMTFLNHLNVPVALSGIDCGPVARHGGQARWDDHRGVGRVVSPLNWLPIVGTVRRHRGDRAVNLVE